MTNTVSFPGLGLQLTINRIALQIGPFTVYWYGLIATLGIVLGIAYAVRRGKGYGLDPDRSLDITMYSVAVGVLGARAYYVIFTWAYYREHPEEIIRIWEGGLGFYGGVIAGVLFALLLCKIWKVRVLRMTDFGLTGLLLGQSIGRWGNFVNVEAFGDYDTGLLRMVSPHIDAYFHADPARLPGFSVEEVLAMNEIPVHPTFLYESVWLLIGFVLLAWYTSRRRFDGELSLLFLFWNGLGRFWIEGHRTDSLMLGSLRVSQALAAVLVVVSAALLLALGRKARAGTLPEGLRLDTWPPAAQEAAPAEEDAAAPSEETENAQEGAASAEENAAPAAEEAAGISEEPAAAEAADASAVQQETEAADAPQEDTEAEP